MPASRARGHHLWDPPHRVQPREASPTSRAARRARSGVLSAPPTYPACVRLIHTSDWHLGRSFHRVGLLDAQAAFLDHLVEVVRAEGVDAVLVSGDVYDRAMPAPDTVALLSEAVTRLHRRRCAGGALQRQPRLGDPARLRLRPPGAGRAAHPHPARGHRLAGRSIGDTARLPPALPRAGDRRRPARRRRAHPRRRAARPRWSGSAPTWPAAGPAPGRSSWPTPSSSAARPATPSATSASAASSAVHPDVFAGVDYVALGHLHGRQRDQRDGPLLRLPRGPVLQRGRPPQGVVAGRPVRAPAPQAERHRGAGGAAAAPCCAATLEELLADPAPCARRSRPGAR